MAGFIGRRIRLLASASVLSVAALGAVAAAPASATTSIPAFGRAIPAAAKAVPAAAPASAATTSIPAPGSTDSFHIFNYHSGLCLGIAGDAKDADAVQYTCLGTRHKDQYWHWANIVGGYVEDPAGHVLPAYQLINNQPQCLGIAGASKREGMDAVGWKCIPSHPDQYWALDPFYSCDGYNPLIDLHSGYVLGVAADSRSSGAHVVQFAFYDSCTHHGDQFWG
jgi:hypothetical protein